MSLFDGVNVNGTSASRNGSGGSFGLGSSGYNGDMFELLSSITNANNQLALQTAREQMGFQASMQRENNLFNQVEAEKNRLWQERMSNTSHQREVQDLIKAGLNPVLSANLGGAAVTSGSAASSGSAPAGAQAQLDMSLASALVNMMAATLNSSTAVKTSDISAKATKYSANANYYATRRNANTKFSGDIFGSLIKALPWLIPFF